MAACNNCVLIPANTPMTAALGRLVVNISIEDWCCVVQGVVGVHGKAEVEVDAETKGDNGGLLMVMWRLKGRQRWRQRRI